MHMKNRWILSLLVFFLIGKSLAQSHAPASPQKKSVLFSGLIIHTGTGKVINNGLIGFKNGKISLVADGSTVRLEGNAYDTVITLSNAHAYPGFIAPNSTLGLTEVESVRATNDFSETGTMNPHIRSQIAFNCESKIIPTARTNGVLLVQPTPRNGMISGTSCVMALDGWNWEDALVKADDGVHLNFPVLVQTAGWWAEPAAAAPNGKYETQMLELKRFFQEALSYCLDPNPTKEKNLRFEAMRNVFQGKSNLYIHVNFAKDILAALSFIKEQEIKRPVLVGAEDSYKVTALIKTMNVPVMLPRVHSLPVNEQDPVDLPYKLPYFLNNAGILFCLQNAGDMEVQNTRNLPFQAGTARAYGLTTEEAIAAISLSTAKILGIDNEFGSVEVGKSATFFISEGDALDMKSNKVIFAFIDGKRLDLINSQWEQYIKYCNKYGIKP